MESFENTETVEELQAKAESLVADIEQMYSDSEFQDVIAEMQVDDSAGMLGLKENERPEGEKGIRIWLNGQLDFAKTNNDDIVYHRRILSNLEDLKKKIETW